VELQRVGYRPSPSVKGRYHHFLSKVQGLPSIRGRNLSILELIQPALQILADLTTTYSKKAAKLHRVLSDLDWANTKLEKLENNPLLTEARARSFRVAGAKIKKYLIKFLHNDWVCAAFALAPDNRALSLSSAS
jgi:hypothetical protein